MSLQVTNQGSTGRRTPLVYQSFGGAAPPGVPVAPGGGSGGTPTNGAGVNVPANAGGGGGAGGGRSAKGGAAAAGGKQSQIPVAVVGTPTMTSDASSLLAGGLPSVPPPTAVVYPGSGQQQQLAGAGVTLMVDGSALGIVTQKQQLLQQQHLQLAFDHQYGSLKQQQQSVEPAVAKEGGSRKQAAATGTATNGSSSNGATSASSAVVEKNGTTASTTPTKKTELASDKPSEGGGATKVRDSPRSSGRTQQAKALDESPKASAEKPKQQQQSPGGNKTKAAAGGASSNVVENSLSTEKSLQGFDDEDDVQIVESMLLDPWDLQEDTATIVPTAAHEAAGGKSKLPKSGPTAHARVAPYKSAGKQQQQQQQGENEEQKAATAQATEEAAPGTPDSNIARPLRSISGRRSTRPISDIKFTHHRKSAGHNDSMSSLNVTVGSDVYMDSLRTPGSATRKRKDMTPESTSEPAVVESPKRARLDFSGLFGIVASPVTMLKSRLSNMKLRMTGSTSTPRKFALDEEENASKVVTAEATTTTTTTSSTTTSDATGSSSSDAAAAVASKMEVDEKDVTVATEAKETEKQETTTDPSAAGGKGDDPATTTTSTTTTTITPTDSGEEEVEVKIVESKHRCSVM